MDEGQDSTSGARGRVVIRLERADASAAIVVPDDGSSFVQLVTRGGKCSWECAPGVVLVAADSHIACAVSVVGDVAFSTSGAAMESGGPVSLWLTGPWRDPARVTVGRFDGRDLVADFVPGGGASATVLPGPPQSSMPDQSAVVVSVPDRELAARVAAQIPPEPKAH